MARSLVTKLLSIKIKFSIILVRNCVASLSVSPGVGAP